MTTVLKYPGAKNRLAKWIVSHMPEHKVYLEPFFGSGAILLNKPKAHIETVNDLNLELVTFFKVLRDDSEHFIRSIELTPFSRQEYNKSYENTSEELEIARRFCIKCWQGFGCSNLYKNGFKSGQQSTSPNPARAWSKLPLQLQEAVDRLKEVQIENLDAIELIKRYDTEDVFIYCDPPYLTETRKNYIYKHEMNDRQHYELLQVLISHKGKVLISGYDNDLYNNTLDGWYKTQKETQAEKGLKRVETLWANYPLKEQISLFDDKEQI